MKKLLFSFALTAQFAVAYGQQELVDFESLPLAKADTFYNGKDNAGSIVVTNPQSAVTFSNYHENAQWGEYWYGFAYSNMTDKTTAGLDNQFSAYPGSGFADSKQYAIYYSDGAATFSVPQQIDSLFITNTTYAALSMLNGDSFGKKFGSHMNASGQHDSTNGEDFFKVWFIGINDKGLKTDSVEFYLADYRGNSDYVIDTWKKVDLSKLGKIESLTFKFESSDMSSGYINTPTYFALDNIYYHEHQLSVAKLNNVDFKVFPNPVDDKLTILNSEGNLTITNLNGATVFSDYHKNFTNIDFSTFENGVYFVSIETNNSKNTHKVIK